MTEVSEQQAKYQKLAAEYSKVRAQNQVLKKAVLEEQQKTCKHSEVLQALRRAEQEKDSLSFRNQQLSCRLSLLQDDLQHLQVRGQRRHSSSGGGGGDNVDVVVLMQELQAKISESASLHARVEELERAVPQQGVDQHLARLQEENALLKERLQKITEALALHERSTKEKLDELEMQRTAASATIAQLNRHVHALKLQLVHAAAGDDASSTSSSSYLSLAPLQQTEGALKGSLGAQSPLSPLEASKDSLKGSSSSLVALDAKGTQDALIPKGRSEDLDAKGIPEGLGSVSSETCSLASLSKDMCDKFGSFVKALCEVQLSHVKDEDVKAKEAIVKAQQGVLYWDRLGPLLQEVFHRLQEPSGDAGPIPGSISATTASTVAQLRVVSTLPPPGASQAALRAVQSAWSATLPYLSALSANSSRSHSHSTLCRLLGLLADRCSALHAALDTAHTQWAAQERDEQDDVVTLALLDLVRTTQSFVVAVRKRLEVGLEKQSDAAISQNSPGLLAGCQNKPSGLELQDSLQGLPKPTQNCLSGLGQATNGLSIRLGREHQHHEMGLGRDNVPTPTSPTSLSSQEDSNISNISGSSSCSGNIVDASGNVTDPSGNSSECPPYGNTLSKPQDLHSEKDSRSSGNAVKAENSGNPSEVTATRLAQLHRQREHWRLEYHLLSHKHAKLMRLLKETGAVDTSFLGSGVAKVNPTSLLGEVVVQSEEVLRTPTLPQESKTPGDEESWRESMIRHHLTSRCSKLFLELTKVCSKTSLLQEEVQVAVTRAREAEALASALEEALEEGRVERARLAEDLRTTCHNYEQQMAAMADHLAGLNEKIAQQEDKKAFSKPSRRQK